MEIDITDFWNSRDPAEFSASRAELGTLAPAKTWRAAMAEAAATPLLTTEEACDALRGHMRAAGAWEDAEIDQWSRQHCNALFIQLISGDIRQARAGLQKRVEDFDWRRYEKRFDGGLGFYRGDNGRVYFYLGV